MYRFVCWLSKIFFKLFYRAILENLENVPEDGALIICANHISLLDMFLFGPPILPRKIHFMAKQELFKIPLLSGILNSICAYSVNRGRGDLNSVKTTLKLLDDGKVVGIFPEGTRRKKNKKKIKPKYGAILFALESGAPILPIGINGNYRLFSKLRVVYGKPYYIPYEKGEKLPKEEMQQLAEQLMEKIYSLVDLE
jgi:1-acyl-sn-glycerol-3-phosphate acyltransferase